MPDEVLARIAEMSGKIDKSMCWSIVSAVGSVLVACVGGIAGHIFQKRLKTLEGKVGMNRDAVKALTDRKASALDSIREHTEEVIEKLARFNVSHADPAKKFSDENRSKDGTAVKSALYELSREFNKIRSLFSQEFTNIFKNFYDKVWRIISDVPVGGPKQPSEERVNPELRALTEHIGKEYIRLPKLDM